MHEFVVIADDFTGANDTGVQLCKKGMAVRVILDAAHIKADGANIVMDTESRVVSDAVAYEKVRQTIDNVLTTGGCLFLYKKVDSTLRGHIQSEIRAAVDTYEPEVIIFVPAYPAQGRTVQQQRLHVHDTPLLDTEIAQDPRNPLIEDNITNMLCACTQRPVKHYSLNEVMAHDVIIKTGGYTFDAVTTEQLRYIATCAIQSEKKILWIGSAGLAEGILSATVFSKPVLAIVGSVSQKTIEQIRFCQQKNIRIISIDMIQANQQQQIQQTIMETVRYLQNGEDVILTAATSRQIYNEFILYGETHGLSSDTLAAFVKETLSQAAADILTQVPVAGLFLTGGDTAIAVIQRICAKGSAIERELMPGFVQGRLYGGAHDGLVVVTKAGAFGTPQDMYMCIECIKKI